MLFGVAAQRKRYPLYGFLPTQPRTQFRVSGNRWGDVEIATDQVESGFRNDRLDYAARSVRVDTNAASFPTKTAVGQK